MITYSYTVFKEQLFSAECGVYVTYGIAVTSSGVPGTLQAISDISLYKAPLLALAEKCNRLQLNPIHLSDVVEDILS